MTIYAILYTDQTAALINDGEKGGIFLTTPPEKVHCSVSIHYQLYIYIYTVVPEVYYISARNTANSSSSCNSIKMAMD